MERQQGKNTLNNSKSNRATPETSGSIARRHEYPNTDETKENDTEKNFMKMIEVLKEEMKNYLTEMEEKTNKKLEEINKSLKDN